jgi:hypothetical protein
LPVPFNQEHKGVQRYALEMHAAAFAAQLVSRSVKFEFPESHQFGSHIGLPERESFIRL